MDDQISHLMNAYARQPVYFTRGQGARLWDTHGREYLDAIAGVAVTNLGHSHPEITAAIADRDGDHAYQAMYDHLLDVQRDILDSAFPEAAPRKIARQ